MAALQRVETTAGPVAVGGRTLTLVARTTGIRVGNDRYGALHVRSRPLYVEVLDEQGERALVRVHDTERLLLTAIVGAAVAIGAARRLRRTGGRTS